MPFIKDVSVEELLKALENKADITYSDLDSVSQFFDSFHIEAGTQKVAHRLLYRFYKEWTKRPISSYFFYQQLHEEFDTVVFNSINCALLNIQTRYIRSAIKKIKEAKEFSLLNRIYRRQLERTFNYYNILPGNYYIEARCLFYLYDCWCYDRKKVNMMKAEKFYKFCDLYFKTKETRAGKYYMVDGSIKMHITPQVRAEIRQGILRAKKRKSNKKK